jgi:hypothetical protein
LIPTRKLSALVVARGNGTNLFEPFGETLDQDAIAMEEGPEGWASLAAVLERPFGGTWITGVGTDVNPNPRPNDRTQAMLANNAATLLWDCDLAWTRPNFRAGACVSPSIR